MRDDSNPVAIVRDLAWSLKLPLHTHTLRELEAVYNARGLIALMHTMQQHVRLNCTIVLHRGDSERDNPCVLNLHLLPLYGTQMFTQTRVVVCIPRGFIANAPIATLVYAIAHEYAHIILHATRNAWRFSERATDVCAALLGYEHAVVEGHRFILSQHIETRREPRLWGLIKIKSQYQVTKRMRYGYLTDKERLGLLALVHSMRA